MEIVNIDGNGKHCKFGSPMSGTIGTHYRLYFQDLLSLAKRVREDPDGVAEYIESYMMTRIHPSAITMKELNND